MTGRIESVHYKIIIPLNMYNYNKIDFSLCVYISDKELQERWLRLEDEKEQRLNQRGQNEAESLWNAGDQLVPINTSLLVLT